MLSAQIKLPESITAIVEGRNSVRCRIAWKVPDHHYSDHGDWFELAQEEFLQTEIAVANIRHAGAINHWIEYQ